MAMDGVVDLLKLGGLLQLVINSVNVELALALQEIASIVIISGRVGVCC